MEVSGLEEYNGAMNNIVESPYLVPGPLKPPKIFIRGPLKSPLFPLTHRVPKMYIHGGKLIKTNQVI